jgi:hypothetical protein
MPPHGVGQHMWVRHVFCVLLMQKTYTQKQKISKNLIKNRYVRLER